MKKVLIYSVFILCAVCLSFGQAVTYTDNYIVEWVDFAVWIPCALDGAGEIVYLNGYLHIVTHTTIDSAGNVHVSAHFQPQKMKGYGETSGDKYNGNGVTRWNYKFGGVNFPLTIYNEVHNFKIIGQGPGNNYRIHINLHMTINANGETTASVDNTKVDCN